MRLDEFLPTDVSRAGADADGAGVAGVEVGALVYDSRLVTPGALFFCVRGFHSDGHEFAAQAVRDGAVALVVERPLGLGVPEIVVGSVRAAMGPIAARFYGDPSCALRVVGVTGTNGKTTSAFLLRALLQAGGEQCGLLGTVKSILGGQEHPVQRTTAEAIDLQGDLRAMVAGGDRACAMEVSSHALELERTAGVHFAAAVFTNLTQDHLDFHDTMEDYFQAKRLLFAPPDPAAAPALSVINVDDPYGRRLAAELPQAITFGVERDAQYRALDVQMDLGGCNLRLQTPVGEHTLRLPLPGRFNVANALGALAAAHALGGDMDVLVAALEDGVRVPGRFEPVQEGQSFAVLVDYAHTPDSLENILLAARELTGPAGKVVCVFGAGGDRDRGKRPLMGAIAARLADVALITSDNPRSEDPEAILAEILAGAAGVGDARGSAGAAVAASADAVGTGGVTRASATVLVEIDRRVAIDQAIKLAGTGDVVVLAGKGHEQGQEFAGGRKVPFDDVTVAREALRARHDRADTGAAA
jgi:UDP-N-acetylmuramoyl-L-alanyl-D-glutamate--2,6-diaminopimelate ligase